MESYFADYHGEVRHITGEWVRSVGTVTSLGAGGRTRARVGGFRPGEDSLITLAWCLASFGEVEPCGQEMPVAILLRARNLELPLPSCVPRRSHP